MAIPMIIITNYFHLQKIYIKIALGVPPAIIPSWIKDLPDFRSLIDIDKKEDYDGNDVIIQTPSIQEEKEEEKDLTDFDTAISKETHSNQK